MTTYTKFKEYIWLVNTIRRAGRITLAEINERWMQTEMSGGVELARTTFNRHKDAIEDIFGIIIDCDRKDGYRYFISNERVLREDSIQNWMLSTLSVGNIVSESKSLNQRILLENIPSGGERLQEVLDAMRDSRQLLFTYHRYGAASREFTIDPYCVRLFCQRWYLLGRLANGHLVTFSLDRMECVERLDTRFRVPDDFDAAEFFFDSYGMLVDAAMPVERIVVRAYGMEPYYLRDLPLHHSQRELTTTEDYTDFELRLRPTSDFKAKLLSRGQWLQVVEPQTLADEMVEWLRKTLERYEGKK